MATLDFSPGGGGVSRRTGVHVQEHKADSVVRFSHFDKNCQWLCHIVQIGQITSRVNSVGKKKGKRTTESRPRRNDKTSNDKEFDCIRVGGISGDQCVFVRSCPRPHSDLRAGERRAAAALLVRVSTGRRILSAWPLPVPLLPRCLSWEQGGGCLSKGTPVRCRPSTGFTSVASPAVLKRQLFPPRR